MTSHTPWKNPPLQEAIFEMRFPPVEDYAIFVGGIAASQNTRFPKSVKLAAAEISPFVQLEGVVKHRFITQEEDLLFQTGTDVISINSIKYKSFASFIKDIEEIIVAAKNFIKIEQSIRLGLRYINVFRDVDDPFSVLDINSPFKDVTADVSREIFFRHVKQEAEDILLAINIQFPIEPRVLLLDIEAFYVSNNSEWQIPSILSWAQKAHEFTWNNFESLVSQAEKQKRQ